MTTHTTRFLQVPPSLPVRQAGMAAASRPASSGAAFWDVWLRHREHLLHQCLCLMSGNMADAEDALSTAMLRASSRYEAYAGEIVSERAWLSRLVRNSCIDHFRAGQRRYRLLHRHVGGFRSLAPAAISAQPSPEQKAIDRCQLARLAEDMDRLPDHLRRPLAMRFFEGMSYAEIAAALDLTNPAVRKRIQLARQRLRETRI